MVSIKELTGVEKHRQEMIRSYADAIRKARGCPDVFLDQIETMTVAEMIEALAQNRVRFTTIARNRDAEN